MSSRRGGKFLLICTASAEADNEEELLGFSAIYLKIFSNSILSTHRGSISYAGFLFVLSRYPASKRTNRIYTFCSLSLSVTKGLLRRSGKSHSLERLFNMLATQSFRFELSHYSLYFRSRTNSHHACLVREPLNQNLGPKRCLRHKNGNSF